MRAQIWNAQREPRSSRELLLWRAVVATAVKDSRNAQSEGHHQAIYWLTTDTNKDRELVCEFADLNEERLVQWAREQYWESM